jgi:LysM repeat protein
MKKTLCFAAISTGAMLAGTGVASAQQATSPPDQPTTRPHTVVAGESLSQIAQAELGTPDRWVEIVALNRDALASPDAIEVGQILAIPAPPVAVPSVAAVPEAPAPSDQPSPPRPHTVAVGESLSQISQAELGASDRWVEIFAVNRATLASPDLLNVGQVLDIPSAPVAVPAELLASLAPAPVPSRESVTTTGRGATLVPAVPSNAGGGGNLAAIRACESGGNYGAVSPDGAYGGAYQFDRQTWQSVGGSGDPAAASPAEQDARAGQLLSQRGSNPWPSCG